MKIEDKRQVVHLLLCCGDVGGDLNTLLAAIACGVAKHIERAAYAAWSSMEDGETYNSDWTRDGIARCYTDAAYRLIESSPTLRREWFGAR